MASSRLAWILLAASFVPRAAGADAPAVAFQPDPLSVQRHGPAYRYPQQGWIVLHIEGGPYERGMQHGRLLASEIAAHLRCFAATQAPKAPEAGWKLTRTLTNALFLRRFHSEYLEEMKGIADGAAAGGAKFEKRPVDLLDIVALNCWAELETLDSALEALPTGLEGIRFPQEKPRAMPDPKPMHCSAFAATGPATADGKIVFGHITMFSLYPANFYNVWLDIKPSEGHRVLMQTYPGGIQSGMDYYLNDAGLVVCETTIHQTRFHATGLTLASRIRHALQYADSIDKAVTILTKENNGLYTNEWLLADVKTNEIAMFELGTHKSKLWRSSKNEWFGGTPGFYWGCNNTKDLDVRLETMPGVLGRPENLVWRPSARDRTWQQLYTAHRGKIAPGFGRTAFTTPPVAAYQSLDAKYTTTDLAKELKTWALFGPPLGRTWQPTADERQQYPEVRPLVSNPWTVLAPLTPARQEARPAAVDLAAAPDRAEDEPAAATMPLWHGTLLPKTDADCWLAAAFADYERLMAREVAQRELPGHALAAAERDALAVELFAARSSYLTAARVNGDVPLSKIRREPGRDEWYRIAAGKGVLLLHELRRRMGNPLFENTMDAFGKAHAGKPVSSADFRSHCVKAAPHAPLAEFFDSWLNQPGLPALSLHTINVTSINRGDIVQGELRWQGPLAPEHVTVTLETTRDRPSVQVRLTAAPTAFQLETRHRPRRLVVDRYNEVVKANGGVFSVRSFRAELAQTLIVYGTKEEAPTNREAAEALQRAILESGPNVTVPLKSDREVTDADLASRHLLLIGRPDTNALVARFREKLPLTFGHRSFVVREETFAHPGSAVFVAADNPVNPRYSMVVLAGLSAEATVRTVPQLVQEGTKAGEAVVLPNGASPRALVLPAKELTYELKR